MMRMKCCLATGAMLLVMAVSVGYAQKDFSLGTPVIVVATSLQVRVEPSLDAGRLGVQDQGARGIVANPSPHWADGFWWWEVRYDDGVRGWSAEADATHDFLVVDPTFDSPTVEITEGIPTVDAGGGPGNVGFLEIRAEPGVMVVLDDEPWGVIDPVHRALIITNVPAGERELQFLREGFLPQETSINIQSGEVRIYNVGSFVPRLEIREEGDEDRADLTIETGSLVVQCLPVECTIDIPDLGIDAYQKTRDRFIAEGVPVGDYAGRIAARNHAVEVAFGVCAGDVLTVFASLVGDNPTYTVESEASLTWPTCEPEDVEIE